MGIYRRNAGPVLAMTDFREDPEGNPLDTPSGKIEIYSIALQPWQKHGSSACSARSRMAT